MPRRLRDCIAGCSYHVTHRGNRKLDIFRDDADRHVYLKLLVRHCRAYKVRIWAYCLMDNHVHQVAVPDTDRALSEAFHRVFGEYARFFNTRYEKVGHLFQGRYKSCVLDEPHLWNAVAYVERNPVRARMVNRAEDYPWSSAAAHCGLRHDPLISPDLPLIGLVPDWSSWLAREERAEDLEFLREATRTGRPCASEAFAREFEARIGRPVLRRKPGPKRKPIERATGPLLFPEDSEAD